MIAVLWLGLLPLDAVAERNGVAARAHVEPDAIALADDLRLTLTVTGPASLKVEPVDGWTFSGWRIRGQEPDKNSPTSCRMSFRLSPERPGDVPLAIPRLRVQVAGRPSPVELVLEPLTIRVSTELPRVDLDEAHPVTGPERLPPLPSARLWPWFVLGGAIAALAMLIAWFVRRTKSPGEAGPEEWARLRLEKLHSLNGHSAALADELASILRGYLERRYRLPVEARTTRQLTDTLRRASVPDEKVRPWRDLLDRCDLAKFARVEMSPEESAEAIRRAQSLLAATLPMSESSPVTETGKFR